MFVQRNTSLISSECLGSHSLFLFRSRSLALVVSSRNTTRATTSVGRVLSELDVLLRVHMNHERGRVHQLASHTNVSLTDQNTGVVHRLRQTQLEHLRLQSAVHQLRRAQLQHVVQLLLLLRHQSQTGHTTDDSSTLEDAARVLLVQRQQLTSSLHHQPPHKTHLADLGKHQLHSPNLTLAAETVLSANAELLVQTFTLVRATRRVEGKTIYKSVRCSERKREVSNLSSRSPLPTVSVMGTSNHDRLKSGVRVSVGSAFSGSMSIKGLLVLWDCWFVE